MHSRPPNHALARFGVRDEALERLPGSRAPTRPPARVVLRSSGGDAANTWRAELLAGLDRTSGFRIANVNQPGVWDAQMKGRRTPAVDVASRGA